MVKKEMKQNYLRQLNLFNPKNYTNKEVAIVGCGAIGSFTCLSLAKMGMQNFILYDYDKIETHNLPNQFYMNSHLNKLKTKSLKNLVQMFVPGCNIQLSGKVDNKTNILSDVVILTTDSMSSRKLAYNKSKDVCRFLIDARMGGQVLVVYTIDLKNIKEREAYEKTLYSDKEATEDKCSEKSIIYNVLGVSSIICNQVKKLLNNEEYKFIISFDYQNLILIKNDSN